MKLHQPEWKSRRRLLAVLMAMGLLAGCQGRNDAEADPHLAANGPDAAMVPPPVQDPVQNGSEALSEELLAEPDPAGVTPGGAGLDGDSALSEEPSVLPDPSLVASPVGEPASEPEPLPPVEILPAPEVQAVEEVEVPAPAVTEETAPEPVSSETVPVPEASLPQPEPELPAVILPVEEPPPPPAQVAPPTALAMDLDELETKLRKTKAIGVFTKLELKNQVEDLIKEMDNYHQNRGTLSLTQLEERFDLLVMKLLLLLQDGDPGLHQQIASARPALWTTLADPDQFATVRGT